MSTSLRTLRWRLPAVATAAALACALATAQTISVSPTVIPMPSSVGSSYSQTLVASGGTPPYSFQVTDGTVPPGLTLDSATGVLSGVPVRPGTFTFRIFAVDSRGREAIAGGSGAIASPLSFTMSVAPVAVPNSAYASQLTGTGGVGPYTYSLFTGELPPGLSLSAGGAITGVPTASGSFVATIQVTDSRGYSGLVSIVFVVGNVVATPVLPGLPLALLAMALAGGGLWRLAGTTKRRRA